MKKFRFREFQVYNDARDFAQEIKLIIKKFPKEEQFSLCSQLWRASLSVILNIAEGSERASDKDFAHFLTNSNASLNEVVACLDIAMDNNYISSKDHDIFLKKCENLSNQITAFRRKLILSHKSHVTSQ